MNYPLFIGILNLKIFF